MAICSELTGIQSELTTRPMRCAQVRLGELEDRRGVANDQAATVQLTGG